MYKLRTARTSFFKRITDVKIIN